MGSFLLYVVQSLITLMIWAIIISAVISWLVAFGVLNLRNPTAYQIARFFEAVTRPILSPFQRFIPTFGGVDVSPVIALILLIGIDRFIVPMIFNPLYALAG